MKVLSLFDGISVLRCALGDRKVEYFASEIDKYAIQVSKKNYPDITQLGDVTKVKDVSGVYLLCGGSPCTDLSIAKKDRQGLKGDHSKLFWEWVRIWKESKPKYFILENVASMPKEDRDIITKELGVEPIMINASLVSAQSRKRLFWTNIPVVGLPADRNIKLKDILQPETEVDAKMYITAELKAREKKQVKDVENKAGCLSATCYKGSQNNGTTLVKTGVSIKKENEEFNQVGYLGAENACGVGGQALRIYDTDKKTPTSGVGLFNIGHIGATDSQANRVYNEDGKSVCLSANGGGLGAKTGLYQTQHKIRKLTPIECERLQSLPDNYTSGVSNTQRYKSLGNAFNCEVIKFILSFLPNEQN